ncbi:MAG: hypothetical protein RIT45_817 [Pseudomonadota bacterium]
MKRCCPAGWRGPSLTRTAARCALLLSAVLTASACGGGPVVEPPRDGRCDDADPWHWAGLASDALHTRTFRTRAMYDLDEAERAVPFAPGPCEACEAVVSYPAPTRHPGGPVGLGRLRDRSYVYDNALYALLRTAEGRQSSARAVLDTLVALQRPDGAWGFSFAIAEDGFYNVGYVRTGTVAWVLYAMARYEARFGGGRYVASMRRAGAFLLARADPQHGLLRGGFGRWSQDGARFLPMDAPTWASTEHNLDAAFAGRAASAVDPDGLYPDGVELAGRVAARLYLADAGHYARGLQPNGPDRVVALDSVGTWSALLDLARGDLERALRGLEAVDRLLGGRDGPWRIWRPGDEHAADTWFVEGSVARAIALGRADRRGAALDDLRQLGRWACAGGVPLTYASRWARDFPVTPAVAPTVWFVFAARELVGGHGPELWNESLRADGRNR